MFLHKYRFTKNQIKLMVEKYIYNKLLYYLLEISIAISFVLIIAFDIKRMILYLAERCVH